MAQVCLGLLPSAGQVDDGLDLYEVFRPDQGGDDDGGAGRGTVVEAVNPRGEGIAADLAEGGVVGGVGEEGGRHVNTNWT